MGGLVDDGEENVTCPDTTQIVKRHSATNAVKNGAIRRVPPFVLAPILLEVPSFVIVC